MIYSVYVPGSRSYEYYESAEPQSATHVGAPAKSIMAGVLGATPEQAAWTLPLSAKRIGTGVVPRGRIAARPSLVPFAGELWQDAGKLELAAIVGIAAYFWWRNRR